VSSSEFKDINYQAVLGDFIHAKQIVPHQLIRLQNEINQYHPKLIMQIQANADMGDDFEVQIGTIAAYCNVRLDSNQDDDYDTVKLITRLLGILEGSRVLGWMGQDGMANLMRSNNDSKH
jgi:hypothetical protein